MRALQAARGAAGGLRASTPLLARCLRIFPITLGSAMNAMMRIVEHLAHVGRLAVGQDAQGARGADHPMTCSRYASSSGASPSTTKPRGVTRRTASTTAGALRRSLGTIAISRKPSGLR